MEHEVATVKFFDSTRRFGFLVADRGGRSIYFKAAVVQGSAKVRAGGRVLFQAIPSPEHEDADERWAAEQAIRVLPLEEDGLTGLPVCPTCGQAVNGHE